jgi:CubicO group peptidase (beta-lactamase class C family)
MKLLALFLLLASPAAPAAPAPARSPAPYWPAEDWQRRTPAEVGMNAARIDEAIAFAKASETTEPRDLERAHDVGAFGREPYSNSTGPFRPRGEPTGMVVRHGYLIAEWGEPDRVDMTFSVTKSFLSSVVGVAFDRKLIRSVDDPVAPAMAPIVDRAGRLLDPFSSPHAKTITWDSLLRQTSDWSGTLWGKPDWADRPAADLQKELARPRHPPGEVYEYNDARVNLLALAALNVWRRPLPQVLGETVMEPIGASRTWRWYGYEDSWVVLDGASVQSVSGGGHWGGGLFISARDQARFGLVTLRRGRWKDRQVLSEEWIGKALTPTPAQPTYGFMNYFLNTGRKYLADAPAEAFVHLGAGTNAIYVDPVNDLVVVVRWIEGKALPELVRRILSAIEDGPPRP